MRFFAPVLLGALLQGVPAWAGARMSGGQVVVSRSASAAAGGEMAGTGFKLLLSGGEAGAAAHFGPTLSLRSGLMPVFVSPGAVTELVAVSKSTGDLELAWTAPGRDGFVGNVSGGVFRIDYSTDPAHPFTPTLFKTELAATHAPGQAYTYLVSGLLPNATYYARVYLGDEAKVFADDGDRLDESTLARAPDPFFADVSPSSVAISWPIPSGSAAGYEATGSSTPFGAPGPRLDVTSATANASAATLVITGLLPGTTYFFRVASLNWQSDRNYSVILATFTPQSGQPLPVAGLSVSGSPSARTAQVAWSNPAFSGFTGVLVLVSTSPFESPITDGTTYAPGQLLAGGEAVLSTRAASAVSDAGLQLDTTYYYRARTIGQGPAYSVSVSTTLFLDLPPMAVAGLRAALSADRSSVTISWSEVQSSADGTPWRVGGAPQGFELSRYEVLRATSIVRAGWAAVASLSSGATSYLDALPVPGAVYYYKIEARDAYPESDAAMAVSTEGDLYAVASDGVTRLKMPRALAGDLLAASSRYGSDLLARAELSPQDSGGNVLSSARFRVRKSPSGVDVGDFRFSRPQAEVSVAYQAVGGVLVPAGAQPAAAPIPESDAARRLGLYWDAGSRFVKVFGRVDPAERAVGVTGEFPGSYQVRALLREETLAFDRSGVSNKAVTPNGDGLNDVAVFTFDNPRDSAVSGSIYDSNGAFVADMRPGPIQNSLEWDGKAGGRPVAGGAYIYQIRGEDKVFRGTVLVIR